LASRETAFFFPLYQDLEHKMKSIGSFHVKAALIVSGGTTAAFLVVMACEEELEIPSSRFSTSTWRSAPSHGSQHAAGLERQEVLLGLASDPAEVRRYGFYRAP